MSCSDKMYFTKEEYIEIKKLWLKTRKKQKRELGSEIWMYPFTALKDWYKDENGLIDFDNVKFDYDPSESNLDIEYMPSEGDSSVFNVSTKVELWLLKNFNLPCIKREVEKQLSTYWFQDISEELRFNLIDELDFTEDDRIYYINNNENISLHLYNISSKDDERLYPIKKVLVYGTTDYLKVIDLAVNQIYRYDDNGLEIDFTFCGLTLTSRNGKLYYFIDKETEKEIFIPFIRPDFKLPKFKHSYKIKDSKKYNTREIILSIGTDNICNSSAYKGNNSLKRLLIELPEYIREQIK